MSFCYISTSVPLTYMFYPYASTVLLQQFVVSFGIRMCESYEFVLAILCFQHFHMNFQVSLSIYAKKIGIMIVMVLTLQINLESIAIITKLKFSIHECRMVLHLFRPSLSFFNNALQILVYRSCTSFVKFITIYLILLDATVIGIVLLIQFLDFLFQLYRNKTYLYRDLESYNYAKLIYQL